jgi:hypothetical protein
VLTVASLACAIWLSSCGAKVANIPPGYIGKILTPTGWEDKIYEAGQVDLGKPDGQGRGNQLVICEATSVTIKEQFGKPSADNGNEDHRVITKQKTPLAVDVYVQVMVPDDKRMRDSIFAQVTPVQWKDAERVSGITLTQIYQQFAQMTIRGKTRQIFSAYKDYDEVMTRYDEASKVVGGMIAETFAQNKVPLKLVAGQLSNVKADETVWAAENQKAAAAAQVAAIEQVGEALRRNPGYIQKYQWDVLKEIAGKQNLTIIVNGGQGSNISYTLPQQK